MNLFYFGRFNIEILSAHFSEIGVVREYSHNLSSMELSNFMRKLYPDDDQDEHMSQRDSHMLI